MKFILLFLSTFFFFGMAHGQVSCEANSGTCALSPGNTAGCQVTAGSKCIVKLNGVCQGVVTNPLAPMGSGFSVFVSAQNLAGGGEDWQTYIGTHMNASGTVNSQKTSYVEDCSVLGCTFNGTPVANGASVTAYQTSSVPFGNTCAQEQRTCTSGSLSGSFTFSSCTVDAGSNCAAVDGVALNHTQSATFYLRPCEDAGNTCSGQARTCTNGSLSGTYTNATCSVAGGTSCTLDGATVGDGAGRYFYNTTSVPFGQSCDTATYRLFRNCSNGVLDGSASFNRASCSTAAAAGCTKDGISRAHGGTYTFYQAASAATCTGESQTCNNGTWSPNNYQNASCTVTSSVTCYYNLEMYTAVSCGAPLINCTDAQSTVVSDSAACAALCDLCPNASKANKTGCTTTGPTTCGGGTANCPSATLGWLTNCSGSIASGTHGQTNMGVTNSASGYSGSAQYTCNNGTWSLQSGATCAATAACTQGHPLLWDTTSMWCREYNSPPTPVTYTNHAEGEDWYGYPNACGYYSGGSPAGCQGEIHLRCEGGIMKVISSSCLDGMSF